MMGLGHLPVLTQPNPENKLFVGGAPPGTDEDTLKNIFEEHGEVEEVFLMRGGSRSGQACAFVRFVTPEGAIAAIQAIHGKYIMPGCSDPLVVRYADAPGSRAKKKTSAYGYGGGGPYGYPGNCPLGQWGGGAYAGGGWPGLASPSGGFPSMNGVGANGLAAYPNGVALSSTVGLGASMAASQTLGLATQVALAAQPQLQLQPQAALAALGSHRAAERPQLQLQAAAPTVVNGQPVEGAPDWAAYMAPDGRAYYYNANTGVSSWERPGPQPAKESAARLLGSLGY